jgi:Glycosyltransferase
MVDDSKRMYSLKKKWFLGIKNMTLVAPSKWMENLIPQSFLKDYPVAQINNGIDIEVFYPTESDTRKKYKCKDKYIIIGVAFAWGERKGLDVFVELANRLDEKFQIVLVGTSQDVDAILPKNIISIHRTLNQNELVEIYTAADLFVNPTREELFGLVNVEALACGTPVLTFRSGGSPEVIDETCGVVVDKNDIDAMEKEVKRICFEKPFSIEACRKRALMFNKNNEFHSYVDLFHNLNILT